MTLQPLPITARVPLIVTIFMVAVSVFTSERVLSRLIETQTRQIQALADLYLDGLSLALVDSMIREDVWQVFDVLDRSQQRPGEIRPAETIVAGTDDYVIASSDPVRIPSQARVPARYVEPLQHAGKIVVAEVDKRAFVRREVLYENRPIGSIYAALDIAPLLAERRQVLWTLVLTNTALTVLLAGAAWFIVGRMMRPMQTLTRHLERSHDGQVSPIPEPIVASAGSEYKRPFAAFNRLAAALAEREAMGAKLAEEERLASLGRLASGMAHEINNPLGGLFNAIDTLKRHGEDLRVRHSTIQLVERGLKGIRDVVRAALESYRAEHDQRHLKPEDVDDLKLLVASEAHHRGVFLYWENNLAREMPLRATSMRQIILNLVLNACQASPRDSSVRVVIGETERALELRIEDAGPGVPRAAVAILTASADRPAPIDEGRGLGLWMSNRLVRELAGRVTVEGRPEGGSRIIVSVPVRPVMELSDVA